MSNKYKSSKDIPSVVLADRLDQLSNNITKGDLSEFVMRIPAELDHCPDLVMSEASIRLRESSSPWISVEDRLPEIDCEWYLISAKTMDGDVVSTMAFFERSAGDVYWLAHNDKAGSDCWEPTHWMPIPDSPK